MSKNNGLRLLKGWPKIHHPLPQTPRESQQLLSALTSSFRRQLDAADTHKPAQSASEHLDAILENPLFRVVPPKPAYETTDSRQRRRRETEDALKLSKNPMKLLDENVAAGTLTGRILKDILRAQLLLIKRDSDNVQQELRKTGAGARVAKWFWASDSASRKSFFKIIGASKASVVFMVAEGLHNELRALLGALYRSDLGGSDGKIPRRIADRLFASLLLDYVEAEISHGQGFPTAFKIFVEVADFLREDTESFTSQEALLKPAVVHLAHFLGQHVSSGIFKNVPVSIFDRYCNVLDALPGLRPYGFAMLIYHPIHPSARPFMKFLRDYRLSPSPQQTEMEQDFLLQTSLNALRLLIDQEKYRDAMKFSRHVKNMLFEERVLHKQDDSYSPQLDRLMDRLTSAMDTLSFRLDPS